MATVYCVDYKSRLMLLMFGAILFVHRVFIFA